jgi:hypothetical protein
MYRVFDTTAGAFSSTRKAVFSNNTFGYFDEDRTHAHRKEEEVLLQVIPKMSHLQKLTMALWQITSVDMLSTFLRETQTLEYLCLAFFNLVGDCNGATRPLHVPPSDDWEALLVYALQENKTLTSLRLQDMNVSENTLCKIATDALSQHPTIQQVDIVFMENFQRSNGSLQRIKESWLQLVRQKRGIKDILGRKKKSKMVALMPCYARMNRTHKDLKGLVRDQRQDHQHGMQLEALIKANKDLGCLHLLLLDDPAVVID